MNQVSIYTKKGCSKCDHLKGILKDQQNVAVAIKDVDFPENANWMRLRNLNTVPILVIYDENGKELTVTFGFTRGNIANKYKQHTGGEIFV